MSEGRATLSVYRGSIGAQVMRGDPIVNRRRFVGALTLALLAVPLPAVGTELAVAPGYRAEVIVSGSLYLIDAIEPFQGALFVSVGAPMPGGRLLRFALPEDAPKPVSTRSAVALWSSARLNPIVADRFGGRVHAGVPDQGRVVKLSELHPPWRNESAENMATFQSQPETLIVGLTALRDLTFGLGGRLLIADGVRILETPLYFTPPMNAAQLRTVHQCSGACQGVAVAGNGDLVVLEADEQTGRVIRRDSDGNVRVVAAGLPRPGEGLCFGPRGDVFFTSEAGLFRITEHGRVIRVLSGLASPARVSLDSDGNPLVTDGGMVLRLYMPVD